MKIVADENVDYGIITKLRESNFDVFAITDSLSGIDDSEVLKTANELKCLLINEDKDFGELVHRLRLAHHGILLIRLTSLKRDERIDIVVNTIINHSSELLNKFSVLNEKGLRIKLGK